MNDGNDDATAKNDSGSGGDGDDRDHDHDSPDLCALCSLCTRIAESRVQVEWIPLLFIYV